MNFKKWDIIKYKNKLYIILKFIKSKSIVYLSTWKYPTLIWVINSVIPNLKFTNIISMQELNNSELIYTTDTSKETNNSI